MCQIYNIADYKLYIFRKKETPEETKRRVLREKELLERKKQNDAVLKNYSLGKK